MNFDMIEPYFKYSAVIAGVISFIIMYFDKEQVKYKKNKEKYFDDFFSWVL